MLFVIPSSVVRVIAGSFLLWVLLSTIIPQAITKFRDPSVKANSFSGPVYPYTSITPFDSVPIRNSTVYYVIGHPDDEVMFFSPSILELSKPIYHNTLKLICLSVGDAVDSSYGPIRSRELHESARILGLHHDDVVVADEFKDGMDETWDHSRISQVLSHHISEKSNVVIVTFDELGTLNFLEKYSFTVLTNIELMVDHVSQLVLSKILKFNINIGISLFNTPKNATGTKIYSDLNMLSVSYAAMAYGHFSQMVWFRYGWLVFSRYLTFNHLIEA
ncbi:N-acetylglucosaminyl-phosphatidylinositol de-N-acetylase [Yamadazyma tenuis]|uniref:N-acetylglucosaminyl-phosphatidylinositol de-N-acetylase n=1 Tax=Candida tenuis TaxID=2315449 RepID=UPI00279D6E78|nr:N-acetylglucosaminyl-phosphatidylinositol de-N-acetylase [Yamadazyma tenuis]